MIEQILDYALLAALAALCGAAILRLTEYRQEKRLENIAKKLAEEEGFEPRQDGQLPRIYRPQRKLLDGPQWRDAIDRYLEKLQKRSELIVAANKRFGRYIFLAFLGFVLVLLAASALLLIWAETVVGGVPFREAAQAATANFVKVVSYYTNACPPPPNIQGGHVVSAISIFHKYAITTIVSGLLPFLLIFARRPSIFGESLREARAHLNAFGSGGDAGYERLRNLLKKELQSDEQQEKQEFKLSLAGDPYAI